MTDQAELTIPPAILAERRRQVEREGYDHAHDDAHSNGELLEAATVYRQHATKPGRMTWRTFIAHKPRTWRQRLTFRAGDAVEIRLPIGWPWSPEAWNPKTPHRDLERAGALVLAEIDRLRRANPKARVRTIERELARIVEAYNALPPPPAPKD